MRIRKVIASLLGPMVIALVIIGTHRPREPFREPPGWLLVVSACVWAQILYWPAAIATRLVGRRLNGSTPQLVFLMAGFSALLSLLFSIPVVYLAHGSYGWHDIVRKALDLAIAGAGAFILYRALDGTIWVPNKPWSGPEIRLNFNTPRFRRAAAVVAIAIAVVGADIATHLYDARKQEARRFAAWDPKPQRACSLTPTVTDAELTLSIPGGRTSFREGEIIPLALSFTSTAKRYRADSREHDRSGRLNTETYCLEPEARDPLADYFSTTFSMGGGLSGGPRQLSEKPFIITAELNEWRQPGPGHYRLYVVSPRVSGEATSLDSLRAGAERLVLRSNTIEFDVLKADAESRAKQLQEATAAYQNTTADEQKQAARRLRFLSTRESADTLARLFWSLNDQPGGWDLMFGLFGSPYRPEVIAAMGREINSPDHPITQDFLQTFTKLQLLQTAGDVPAIPPMDDRVGFFKWKKTFDEIQAREPGVKKAAVASTVAAVPLKTGRARALTVLALSSESSDLLDKETASQMRRQLAPTWGDLPEKTKRDLIEGNWAHWGNEVGPLAGRDALPILLEFVSQPAPQSGNEVMSRNAALKRIFDLDPAQGRSLILRDLSDLKAQPSISVVKLLSPDELRPVVQQAVQRIATAQQRTSPFEPFGARPLDYSLVEMFADKSALGSLEANFKVSDDRLPKGSCFAYVAPMLRYFLRVDPMFGAKEVQAALDARKVTHCYPTLLEDLGSSLPQVEPLAIGALDDEDPEVASSAARALGRWGTAKAESPLWTRLTRFHEEWPTGVGELPLTDNHTTARVQALDNLEDTLVSSIVTGTNWICGPEKLTRLRALASRQQRMALSNRIDQWESGRPWALVPNYWDPKAERGLTFQVLQYSDLNEDQIRVKLSQLPRESKLYFRTYTADQMSNPISMEKQQAVLQGLRSYAAQFGVTVEEWPPHKDAS